MTLFNRKTKQHSLRWLLASILVSTTVFANVLSAKAAPEPIIEPGTGLIVAEGFELVKAHCTACHSGKLVSQNKMSRESWLTTIRWMQKTQGLWPLGPAETVILDYLEANYHPVDVGRRPPLPKALMPVIK